MKILVISNMYPSAQKPYAGVFVKNQVEKLKEIAGNENVTAFCMKRAFTGPAGSVLKYVKAFFQFIPYYFRHFDIIHVHFFYPLILLAYFYKLVHPGVKIVVTFHGSDITHHIQGEINRAVFKMIAAKVDKVISVGIELAREVETKLEIKDQIILSAGVDNRVFYNLPNTPKIYDFIFVGSFVERKGIDLLIKAINILGDKNIKYCFVGSGPYSGEIRKIAQEYNAALFENQTQEQLRVLYNQSRFFILPSRDEPFGLVCTEAIFCGTPVIVSPNGGLKEQVQQGENGFVLDNLEPLTIAEKLKDVMAMPPDQYSRMAVSCLGSNKAFALDQICEQSYKLYQSLHKR